MGATPWRFKSSHPHSLGASKATLPELLTPSRASIATNEPKGRSLRCVQLPVQLQIDPEGGPRLGITQFDLGRFNAHRREADDNVGPPVIGDGVSD